MPFVWLYFSRKMTELGFGGKHFNSFFVVVKRRHLEKSTNARLCTTSSILKSEKRYIETAAKRQLAKSSRKKKDTLESSVSLAKIPTSPSAGSGDGPVVETPPPDLGLQICAPRRNPRTRRRRAEGRPDTRKLKKKDPPEDVIFQKTDAARVDELSVVVLDSPSCDSSVGSNEPPTAQIAANIQTFDNPLVDSSIDLPVMPDVEAFPSKDKPLTPTQLYQERCRLCARCTKDDCTKCRSCVFNACRTRKHKEVCFRKVCRVSFVYSLNSLILLTRISCT
jgi:hypothetical protein